MEISQDFLSRMLAIVKEAGQLSLDLINDSRPDYKKDQSIITKADTAISALTRRHLSDLLAKSSHLLIDEEDPHLMDCFNQDTINKKTYIWALDPIDGTRLYANRMPLYGISLGLLKDLKPWLGVVYFPMLRELFYADGQDAYWVKHAFTTQETKIKIQINEEQVSGKSLFFCNDSFFDKFYWDDKDFHIMIHACAVVNLCWPTVGRGIGCFQRCYLWDYAGSWPIIQQAGFNLYRVSDGSIMDQLDLDRLTLHPRPWQMKEYYLIACAHTVDEILSKIKRR